ncbi:MULTISPECIES: DNA polymerase I [unclassified Sporosarcina]|uniref:DNA polymerase I n=1 Tax=unclassified Sporosarcina TaxID=2647733 RepID=UPI00203DB27E|nr:MULTISPECIES: DNA polymerase I [unclassified Sporosarcina]GKV66876.1 DNA polymerase I [Sporosarcina sp. NCCP-2331]GLB57171.1 DNA polymerase I [Sporosarcina sp. NCCP-2378]
MTKKKIVLLDGNSLAYRAFFALPLLTNDKGIHTNAVYGFTMMLENILDNEKPTHILVAWDAGKTTFRHSTFTEYKGGRQKTPPELSEQFPYIRKLVEAFGIEQYELDLYEADDIIGTLSRECSEAKAEVVIISGDKDLTQLANEHTTVCITRKGITDLEKYTPEHIEEKYGIAPLQIIDMKGLMGDASDNIPGVPGIGEKTALKLLKEYGSVEKVYESIEQITAKKMKENLVNNKEQAIMSKELATIEIHAPISRGLDDLDYAGKNDEAVIQLYKELQFNSLLEKMDAPVEVQTMEEVEIHTVSEVTADMLTETMSLHVEIDGDNYLSAAILGIGLADDQNTYFIPTEVATSSAILKGWVEDRTKHKYASDSKSAYAALARLGMKLNGSDFDLMLAAYIVNPSFSTGEVSEIARSFGYHGIESDETVYGKGAKRALPSSEKLADHTARKAHAVWELYPIIEKQLEENEQQELFHELELPLAKILGKMEVTGVKTDLGVLQTIGLQLSERLALIEKSIYEMAGEKFNINSPKQLGVILFEKIGLTPIKKTKTGYSTAADVLEKLESEHEIIQHILLYRQLGKLNSTYIEGLSKEIHEDGKIHTRFQQALTQTGRLSSINPNLQNIPIRLEEGRKIRAAFIPSKPGWIMFAADYSQIELRVLAHISQDEKLIDAFRHGADIHTKTAMDVFGVGEDEVDGNMRRAAKAVNFGIVYGISDYGLSQSLNITRKEAGEFIDTYLASFPGVKQYMDDSIIDAKQKGYVTTLLKRRRYLPDITSSNFNLRGFAERTAMNTPIQGTAADIIKKAMIDMDTRLEKENLQARMLLQVHDELIFEAPIEELEKLKEIVPEVMEQTIQLDVPLKVDWDYGESWYETK